MLLKEMIFGQEIILETGGYYFSPKGIDRGTMFLLSKVQVTEEDKVLDLGCGYGVVGIYIAKEIGEKEAGAFKKIETKIRKQREQMLGKED